ncbi:bifunctional tetrahydrofolate synthase/dihydrofolate synthase [Candidatus Fukatsuia endosymbiont of Tuberolachnus salignus]|uniref:bifunctional tetrahydrofolate synthase/dihydrofolate synthase n=1 Tax=Candidatus Fukatsuia endosymbiont of Tuberolachnus salignus TaxID=3077957 RepID=UPI00313F25A8
MNNPPPLPQPTSSLATWLSYVGSLHHQEIDLGLERIKKVAERIDLLKPATHVFTIAGTNGKGTTCCVLEKILLAAGLRVGVYSSPHLLRYTERVRIQGRELSETAHCYSFAEIEAARGDISLTYFEFGTLSALHLFKQAALDVVILEVGLGGRLDATNIIDSDVAAITSIGLDHTDRLGTDRESIAREKSGIFRRDKPAIVGEPDRLHSIETVATTLGARLYRCHDAWQFSQQDNGWCWQSGSYRLANLPLPKVPLQNAATALAVLHYSTFSISELAIHQGLQAAYLPGRFQIVSEQPMLILDVAHNPHAAAYLARRLAQLPERLGKVRAVVAMLADKDIAATLACLSQQVDKWYCASLTDLRGASVEWLAQHLPEQRANQDVPCLFADVTHAWHQAMQDADPQDVIIVCGSFHTVAYVMTALKTV